MPINAPLEYWDDSIQAALFVAFSLRYLIVLNISWLITSAHFIWGLDKKHKPSDSNMIFLVTKSYWPQYHYLLPFDYQTGEFGNYGNLFIYFDTFLTSLPLTASTRLHNTCYQILADQVWFKISNTKKTERQNTYTVFSIQQSCDCTKYNSEWESIKQNYNEKFFHNSYLYRYIYICVYFPFLLIWLNFHSNLWRSHID